MKVAQKEGKRGSLKWIQVAVNKRPHVLDSMLLDHIPGASRLLWRSPLESERFTEYRDRSFLDCIGHPELADELAEFWPSRGPQWDALAWTDTGEVILVEAKAHLDEVLSGGMKAGPASAAKIEAAFARTASDLGARPSLPWSGPLYQTANRLAHLHFLAAHGIPARLVFVCFVGDDDMDGPASAEEWRGALHMVWRMLGLPKTHKLSKRVIEIFPRISELQLSLSPAARER